MPKVGDVYSLSDHQRLTVTVLGDELLEVEAVWEPGGVMQQPPLHRHRSQDEHFVIREGELRAVIDGEERILRPGDVIDVPAGTPHAMWSTAEGPSRATWQVRPALRTAELWAALTEMRAASAAGRTPSPEDGQALLKKYAPEFELVL
jgi:mannose-6-phosphate isomerase-like protein (cupin superfamily)